MRLTCCDACDVTQQGSFKQKAGTLTHSTTTVVLHVCVLAGRARLSACCPMLCVEYYHCTACLACFHVFVFFLAKRCCQVVFWRSPLDLFFCVCRVRARVCMCGVACWKGTHTTQRVKTAAQLTFRYLTPQHCNRHLFAVYTRAPLSDTRGLKNQRTCLQLNTAPQPKPPVTKRTHPRTKNSTTATHYYDCNPLPAALSAVDEMSDLKALSGMA